MIRFLVLLVAFALFAVPPNTPEQRARWVLMAQRAPRSIARWLPHSR